VTGSKAVRLFASNDFEYEAASRRGIYNLWIVPLGGKKAFMISQLLERGRR
jgi:hypothetical protein